MTYGDAFGAALLVLMTAGGVLLAISGIKHGEIENIFLPAFYNKTVDRNSRPLLFWILIIISAGAVFSGGYFLIAILTGETFE